MAELEQETIGGGVETDADRIFSGFVNLERTGEFAYARTLDRMRRLLEALGSPETRLGRIAIVAGSKGKSSTSLYLARLLKARGLRVGLYVSPHVDHWSERIQFDGQPITNPDAAPLLRRLEPLIQSFGRQPECPTYFEWMTAFAFLFFESQKPDVTVLEVGLGGTLDATNAADASVAVITRMALEHQKVLGHTLAEITREKCGVIRPRGQVVTCGQEPEAMRVIEFAAEQAGASLFRTDLQMSIQARDLQTRGQEVTLTSPWGAEKYATRIWGLHQAQNLALAFAAAHALRRSEKTSVAAAAHRAVELDDLWPALPGRMDYSEGPVSLLIDGAHNAESATALAEAVTTHLKPIGVRLVLGTLKDKDPQKIFEALKKLPLKEVWTVSLASHRSRSAEEIAACLQGCAGGIPIRMARDSAAGLSACFKRAAQGDLMLVAGSLYLAGEARRWRQSAGLTFAAPKNGSAA